MMKNETLELLNEIATNESRFNSLYKNASAAFHLPDGRMWILYFLLFSDDEVTQLGIADRMLLPRQTVNSAAKSLCEDGLIELTKKPGSKLKKITLTEEGRRYAEGTVQKMLDAECRAVERMGKEKIRDYIRLYSEFYDHMSCAFREAGIIDA